MGRAPGRQNATKHDNYFVKSVEELERKLYMLALEHAQTATWLKKMLDVMPGQEQASFAYKSRCAFIKSRIS